MTRGFVLSAALGIVVGLAATPVSADNQGSVGPIPHKLDFTSSVPGAAASDDTKEVERLLHEGRGAGPNDADEKGVTALSYAAMHGNVAMAKLLIDQGAWVDVRDHLGNTALHFAAQRGSVDVMTLLIDAKAPIDVTNKQGVTPLMMAASGGQPTAVRLLLSHGADVTRQDFTGRDALGWAAGKPAVIQALRDGKRG
ncbi:MAG TPA: ankyrin repeat domain-containing protein [Stellaceae bacterium]|nr:ankyrin repeat domain-containing protein [Stellaceae bacterium]